MSIGGVCAIEYVLNSTSIEITSKILLQLSHIDKLTTIGVVSPRELRKRTAWQGKN